MALAEMKVAWDTLKAIKSVAEKANQIEIKAQVIELQGQLIEFQEDYRKVLEENASLKDTSALREKLQAVAGVYWMGAGREEKDGPYCTCCFDAEGKLVRLTYVNRDLLRCGNCKNSFDLTAQENRGWKDPPPGRSSITGY